MSEEIREEIREEDIFNTVTPEEAAKEVQEKRDRAAKYLPYLSIGQDKKAVVRFLDDKPLNFYQHRVYDPSAKDGTGSWRMLTCLRSKCPMCKVETPRYVGAYRLIHIDNLEEGKAVPRVKVFVKGIQVVEVLERKNRRKPISSENFEIERIGAGINTKYIFENTGDQVMPKNYVMPEGMSLEDEKWAYLKEMFKPQPEVLERLAKLKLRSKSLEEQEKQAAPGKDTTVAESLEDDVEDGEIPF
jgi:hypothetical protein